MERDGQTKCSAMCAMMKHGIEAKDRDLSRSFSRARFLVPSIELPHVGHTSLNATLQSLHIKCPSLHCQKFGSISLRLGLSGYVAVDTQIEMQSLPPSLAPTSLKSIRGQVGSDKQV